MKKMTRMTKIKCMILLLLLFCISQVFTAPCGDVNSSSVIDIVDALMIAQYYVGLNPANFDSAAADVNGDGGITIVDALMIAQYYVKLITVLPGCVVNSNRLRVMMSSDIGGTDNDDQQSMVHFLVYTDLWDVEGLISSPWGSGRASDILECIDAYEADYRNLVSYSSDYPTPGYLRSVTKQGATDKAPSQGYRQPTVASEWIAQVAMNGDPRPLWITVWGGIEDLAQALHDHPEIERKLRVYWIAGPNRRNSPDASKYIANNHKNLWIIEADETYRGFFNGGNMSGDLSNTEFPKQHINGHGELGKYFMAHRTDIKMGDTPAVTYTIDNEIRNPGDPTQPGWGGAFIPNGGDRPFCWKDDPSKSSNGYDGAATVNIHREAFLRDFQARMDRCKAPK